MVDVMPEQYDYGTPERGRTLVPGALTAFRHFGLNMRTKQLQPMNYSDPLRMAQAGWSFWYGNDAQKPYDPGRGGAYEAECLKPDNPWSRLRTNLAGDSFRPPEAHEAPKLDCTCGFYASYHPKTDFYDGMHWGPQYAREMEQAYPDLPELVMIRAVVELSGPIVMGRVGVRAGKMKIVAIAVDFEKYISPPSEQGEDFEWLDDVFDIANDSVQFRMVPKRKPIEVAERSGARVMAQEVAALYGVRYYADVRDMHADHPPANLEALGVEPNAWGPIDTVPPVLSPGSVQISPASIKAFQAVQAAQAHMYAAVSDLKDAVLNVSATFNSSGFASGGTMPPVDETVKDRALRLKKNRPAAPGSGIDRRRGRLKGK